MPSSSHGLPNDKAIELLKKNKDSLAIDWIKLSSNPKAIELLLENPDKIVWDEFSKNPKEYQDKL